MQAAIQVNALLADAHRDSVNQGNAHHARKCAAGNYSKETRSMEIRSREIGSKQMLMKNARKRKRKRTMRAALSQLWTEESK
jgi:hypothetical protein